MNYELIKISAEDGLLTADQLDACLASKFITADEHDDLWCMNANAQIADKDEETVTSALLDAYWKRCSFSYEV